MKSHKCQLHLFPAVPDLPLRPLEGALGVPFQVLQLHREVLTRGEHAGWFTKEKWWEKNEFIKGDLNGIILGFQWVWIYVGVCKNPEPFQLDFPDVIFFFPLMVFPSAGFTSKNSHERGKGKGKGIVKKGKERIGKGEEKERERKRKGKNKRKEKERKKQTKGKGKKHERKRNRKENEKGKAKGREKGQEKGKEKEKEE